MRRPLTAFLGLALAGAWAPALHAQEPWPYRVAVIERAPRFADPLLDPATVANPTVSYPELIRIVLDGLAADPRIEVVPPEALLDRPTEDEESSRQLGDISRDLGIEQFSQYEIGSAITSLERAIYLYRGARALQTHPRDVAPAFEYLARAHLEWATLEPGTAPESEHLAREAFGEMIRLNPNAAIREGLYPSAVVEQFQAAYLDLLQDDGDDLALDTAEADALLEQWEADVLVYPYFLRDEAGTRLVLQVHAVDTVNIQIDESDYRESVALPPTQDGAADQVDRAVSRFLACVPVRYHPPPPVSEGDRGRFFLSAGWSASVYADGPTDGQFLNQGVSLSLDHHVTNYLGLAGRMNIQFGGRDPDGDLLDGFTSTRIALGVAFSYRFGRLRPFLGTGLELNFVGSFVATDNFWCKVSGGRIGSFGPNQCLPSDLNEQGATVLAGPYLMPGLSVDVADPFAIYAVGLFAFYVRDADANIDFPVGGEAGIEYRF